MRWSNADMGAPDHLGITDAGADRASQLKDQKALEQPRRPKTGSYLDGAYVYFYNAGTDDLFIVLSPKGGTTRTQVTSGSAAFNAIMATIRNGKATMISASRVKELRAAAGGSRKSARRSAAAPVAHVHEAEAEPAPVAAEPSLLSRLPPWAPWAAGGVVLSLVASAVLFASPSPRRAPVR